MKNKKGFTMIELLVVIAVIVLIVSLAIIALTQARVRANNSRIMTNMDQIRKQAEAIYAENEMGSYCTAKACFKSDDSKLKNLVADIYQKNGGFAPKLLFGSNSYCFATQLADTKTVCFDNTGKQSGTSYGPTAGTGLCGAVGTEWACQ